MSWYEDDHPAKFYRLRFYADVKRFLPWLFASPWKFIKYIYNYIYTFLDKEKFAVWKEKHPGFMSDLEEIKFHLIADKELVKESFQAFYLVNIRGNTIEEAENLIAASVDKPVEEKKVEENEEIKKT